MRIFLEGNFVGGTKCEHYLFDSFNDEVLLKKRGEAS